MISPQVHRALYRYSIKHFLKKKKINSKKAAEEYGIDLSEELGYSRLLDRLMDEGKVSVGEVDKFLHQEFNYGRMKNVYISKIAPNDKLNIDEYVISCVGGLSNQGYTADHFLISSGNFIGDYKRSIPEGQKVLLYFEIKREGESTKSIHLLFAENAIDPNGHKTINYIPVEIRLDYSFLVIRLRNWGSNENEDNNNLNTMHNLIRAEIVSLFGLRIISNSTSEQKIVFNVLSDLTNSVLNPTISVVNDALKADIENDITKWSEALFDSNIIPDADREVIVQQVLYAFYKLHLFQSFGGSTITKLIQLGIEGYPRYVKFLDDTVGEGRARSSNPKESLLDTSIFYDIKARLDQAKSIRLSTVYWITAPGYKRLGTSFHTFAHNQFKCVILPNFFNEGISEYVLQKVKKYS
ncbi:hypothetical protein J2T12_001008 [Paenibacillus anaericanus]|uniref:hypothetical protein n=1 Tax=Paenibacillus anaericanus TaxID=170367 RepID=UPI00278B85CB|nr:hypothetical protein [Paenibacillus anaericanus]MDQ0087614.1 hypothetical protein [Paenibacillus anaericanus]